jgi:LysM repeat protein
LFTRLERYVFPVLVTLGLCAAVVVALPAPAQAQAAFKDGARGADSSSARGVVVHSGDSLWSISSEELGPDATPQQIYNETARIYALNREQIGPDPNFIFAGQRLSVPPALSGPPTSEPPASKPSASGRSAGTEPPAREAAKEASAGDQASHQAKHETLGAPRRAAKQATLPDVAQAAPVPMARPLAAEEPPRSPGESFVDNARAAIANATSALVGRFPSEGYESYTWRELLGAALLAVSSVAAVLTIVLALALVVAPERAKRAQRGGWWREVRANERSYEHATLDTSFDEGLENGTTGAHANGANANGNVSVGMLLAAERKRGRLRRRGRPRSPDRHVRRHARKGLAHGAYSPGIQRQLRGAPGHGSRRPASRPSAACPMRTIAQPSRMGVGGR